MATVVQRLYGSFGWMTTLKAPVIFAPLFFLLMRLKTNLLTLKLNSKFRKDYREEYSWVNEALLIEEIFEVIEQELG